MLTALAARVEHARDHIDNIDGDVLNALAEMPEFCDGLSLVWHMRGLVASDEGVMRLAAKLLPGVRYSVRPAIVGDRWWSAYVAGPTDDVPPVEGLAPTKARALLAAILRAYAARVDAATMAAGPVGLSRFRGAGTQPW